MFNTVFQFTTLFVILQTWSKAARLMAQYLMMYQLNQFSQSLLVQSHVETNGDVIITGTNT